MKTLLIVLSILLIQKASTESTRTVSETASSYASVFRKQIDPYLKKFVQLQYDPAKDRNDELFLQAEYMAYAQKADLLNRDFIKFVTTQKDVTDENIYRQLDKLYRYEFPGLDKSFFDNVKKEIDKIK